MTLRLPAKKLCIGCVGLVLACGTASARQEQAHGPDGVPAPYHTPLVSSSRAMPTFTYPKTRRDNLVEEKFGEQIADPYRWLENDVRSDREVRAWVTAENAVTDQYLDQLPGRSVMKDRMEALFNYERYSVPRKAGSRYFYAHNSGLQNQSPLYVRDAWNGPARELIDPNAFAKDGATALAEWAPSMDGEHVVYAVQEGGSDWRTLHVLRVDDGTLLPDAVQWVKFSALEWDKAGEGFFYSRFPQPEQGAEFQAPDLNSAIYYHRLGTDQSEDKLVFDTPRHPKWRHTA